MTSKPTTWPALIPPQVQPRGRMAKQKKHVRSQMRVLMNEAQEAAHYQRWATVFEYAGAVMSLGWSL